MTTRIARVPTLERVHEHNARTVGLLLARCRAEGTVRADATLEDVLFALAALGRAVPAAEAARSGSRRRFLALLLDGLRTDEGRRTRGEPGRDGGAPPTLPGAP
ncbi:hypothetical protein GCM10023082_45960 [Streptomyces tremellae]|uniref:Transcriptional regulator SbtR-like C-terminal domain-containing protein n=2 Tax=Streptomyces tremellae TaxID=1124239 RepID=A0ABP7FPU7_9ACTN